MCLPHLGISGGTKALLEYAHRLAGRGHDVTVFTEQPLLRWTALELGPIRVPVPSPRPIARYLRKPAVSWRRCAADVLFVPEISDRWVPDADATVASAWQDARKVLRLGTEKGRKVYFVQHYEPLYHASDGERAEAERTYDGGWDEVVCISRWLRAVLAREHSLAAPVLVTPVDPLIGGADVVRREPGEPFRVCLLDHSYEWKGTAEGIRAVEAARTALEGPLTLVMFGTRQNWVARSDEHHGTVVGEELRHLYRSCHAYLCPSWREGLGMPSMEAMACGAALVTTEHGGARDYAAHGKTALTAEPGDWPGLFLALRRLALNESERRRLARNGKRRVDAYSWSENTDELIDLLSR